MPHRHGHDSLARLGAKMSGLDFSGAAVAQAQLFADSQGMTSMSTRPTCTTPSGTRRGGTYVETEVEFSHHLTHEWNHGLGEILWHYKALAWTFTHLEEHNSAPGIPLASQMTRDEQGEWRLTDQPERLPATYTLQARRR